MVAAEAAAAGCPPLVARHSGLAEVAEGLEAVYPNELRQLASFATEMLATCAGSWSSCSRSRRRARRRCRSCTPRRRRSSGAGRASPSGSSPSSSSGEAVANAFTTVVRPHGRGAATFRGRDDRSIASAVRGCNGLHGRRRGGVRARRPGLARPHEPLRGREGSRAGNVARRPSRRRADRIRGRGADGALRDVRRRARRDGRAPLAAAGARRADGAPPRRDGHASRGPTGRTSASSTRRTTGETTSCSATSSGATTRSACTSTLRSTAPIVRSR